MYLLVDKLKNTAGGMNTEGYIQRSLQDPGIYLLLSYGYMNSLRLI